VTTPAEKDLIALVRRMPQLKRFDVGIIPAYEEDWEHGLLDTFHDTCGGRVKISVQGLELDEEGGSDYDCCTKGTRVRK
jgi:hypothetical protein